MKDSDEFNKLWMGWNEINLIGQGKRIICFGRGTWMSKTLNYLTATPAYVVDNSRYEQGEVEAGLRVYVQIGCLKKQKIYLS